MNHFELLGLQVSYKINKVDLKKKYLLKQMQFHPDKAPDEKRVEYLEKSMQINDAYKIITDDYNRAEYMLKLRSVKFNDDELKNALSHKDLAQILEQHEELEEADSKQELEELLKNKLSSYRKLVELLEYLFTEEDLTKALDITIKLKYLTNLVGNIKLKLKHANNRD